MVLEHHAEDADILVEHEECARVVEQDGARLAQSRVCH